MLLNQTPTSNHWLIMKMTGHRSNRDGIGAEVKVVTARGMQMATVTTAGSYLSSSDKRVHFGRGRKRARRRWKFAGPAGSCKPFATSRLTRSWKWMSRGDAPRTPLRSHRGHGDRRTERTEKALLRVLCEQLCGLRVNRSIGLNRTRRHHFKCAPGDGFKLVKVCVSNT